MTSPPKRDKHLDSLYSLTQDLLDLDPQSAKEKDTPLFKTLNLILSGLKKEERKNFFGRRPGLLNPKQDHIYLLDIEGNVLYVNNYLRQTYGDDNYIDLNLFESYPTASDLPQKLIIQAFNSGEIISWENKYEQSTLLQVVFPVKDPKGQVDHSYLTVKDVTGKRDLKKELEEKDLLLKSALQLNDTHIWETDLINNLLIRYNYKETINGLEHLELVESMEEAVSHFHPDDLPNVFKPVQDHLDGLTDRIYHESRIKLSDGEYYWHSFSGKIIDRIKDTPVRVIGLATNIHEQKVAEESQRNLEAQLYHTQKMEAIGRMAGSISHDFNNLLTAIIGQAELSLMNLPEENPLHQDLNTIMSAAQRAGILAKQLLSISRKQKQNPVVLNLNESIQKMLPLLKRLAGEKISLELDLNKNLKETKIDPSQIDQILVNLVVNARDAIDNRGKIFISTSCSSSSESNIANELLTQEGEFILLTVSDTGSGIPKEILNRVFEPFFTTKPEGKGTGLGLATTYGIVKQNHGAIHVYSEPNSGTTFKIYLPMTHQNTVESSDEDLTSTPPSGTETILIVEDEDAVRTLATATLEKYGYRVLDASNSSEANEILKRETNLPDLIITDVFLPDTSGPEFISSIKEMLEKTKVMYMSGYTSDFVRDRHTNLEKISFLGKPFRPIELLILVRKVLDS